MFADAVQFSVPASVDRVYFFNPFSIEILKKVLARVLESYYENPRDLFLFFYYPSDEYISYLMTVDELVFCDEIDAEICFRGKIKESGLWCLRLDSYSADGNRFCFGRKCIIVIAEKGK